MNKALFSSNTDNHYTPQETFDQLSNKYGPFDVDVCADAENKKVEKYYDKQADGLSKDWTGKVWMNPPYGREIGKWMKKAYESALNNKALVCCLVPARTDTAWWHDYAQKGEVTFLRGRLKFGGAKNSAPFPSAVVVFKP